MQSSNVQQNSRTYEYMSFNMWTTMTRKTPSFASKFFNASDLSYVPEFMASTSNLGSRNGLRNATGKIPQVRYRLGSETRHML